jgi:CHAP domain
MHPPRPVLSAPWAALVLLLALLGTLLVGPPAQAASVKAAPVVVRGCTAVNGARTLGYYYADAYVRVYACGARPSFDGARNDSGPVVRPYAGSMTYYRGYQCIELVARYLKARYGAGAGRANGAQAVDRYVAAYPTRFLKIANGTRRMAPRKGDVLSLSTNGRFNDVGHTGIVISSTISSTGNGSVLAVEQNWGGTGGTRGYHSYRVRSWRVQYAPMPYIKWLRAR